jgi:ATP-dependent RNA helicase DeaD
MTEETETQGTIPEAVPAAHQADILPEYTMEDLPQALREGFDRLGWTSLMPVQARAIPYILAHRDVMIQSRTGSGKTGAYLTPILQQIHPEQNTTQALVLAPTRELAHQVVHEAEILGSALQVRTVAVYGGVSYGPQLDAFRSGAHLVVGTPGRILDHLLRRSMTLDRLRIMVFDEADRMLSMGFYPDMRRVQRYLPDHPISTYMFSATFPPQVISLAREFMVQPDFINLSSDHVHVTETEHTFYTVPAMDKERSLIRIIEVENPASAILFCNTRERVHFVATILERYGYNAAEISSDLSQAAREEVMARIRAGTLRFLVATDVAARGIDLPELTHVILYEAPEDPESYIHRAGRTGRAGSSGVAISLVNALEKAELLRIGRRYAIDLQERPLPSDEDVQQIVAQRTLALLEARLRERDRLQSERMERFAPLLNSLREEDAAENEALAGIAMLLDDFYHEAFHTAQMPQPEGTPPPRLGGEPGRAGRRRKSERKPSGRGGGRGGARGEWSGEMPGGDVQPQAAMNAPETAGQRGAEEQRSGTGSSARRRRRRGRGRRPDQPAGGSNDPPA